MLLPVPVPVPVGPRSSRCVGARGPLWAGLPPARPAGGLGRTAGLGAGARAADAALAGGLAEDSGRGAAVCWAMTTGLAAHAIANRGPSAAWTAESGRVGRRGRTTWREGMVGPFAESSQQRAAAGPATSHRHAACLLRACALCENTRVCTPPSKEATSSPACPRRSVAQRLPHRG